MERSHGVMRGKKQSWCETSQSHDFISASDSSHQQAGKHDAHYLKAQSRQRKRIRTWTWKCLLSTSLSHAGRREKGKKTTKKTSNGSSRTVWFTLLSRSESAESEHNSNNEWSELNKENMVAASLPFSRHVILTTKEPTTRRITSWSVAPTFQQAGAPQQRPLRRICSASLGERRHFKVFRETKFIYGLKISDQKKKKTHAGSKFLPLNAALHRDPQLLVGVIFHTTVCACLCEKQHWVSLWFWAQPLVDLCGICF